MSERETRDLMSVEAFSQLPFIRPTPAREKATSTAIRLFGIEVPHEADNVVDNSSSSSSSSKDNNNTNTNSSHRGNGDNGRKFECHYCCRNFSTSQALGGHQNAHKRERQHAKRSHLQSALAAAAHHHPTALGEGHMYGLVNYHHHRFGVRHGFDSLASTHYSSWGTTSPGNLHTVPRFYGGPGSVSQPINGNPLPGLWRVPPATQGGESEPIALQRERSMALPLFTGSGGGNGTVGPTVSSFSPSPPSRISFEPKAAGVKDHLSLDLHL